MKSIVWDSQSLAFFWFSKLRQLHERNTEVKGGWAQGHTLSQEAVMCIRKDRGWCRSSPVSQQLLWWTIVFSTGLKHVAVLLFSVVWFGDKPGLDRHSKQVSIPWGYWISIRMGGINRKWIGRQQSSSHVDLASWATLCHLKSWRFQMALTS